MRFPHLPVDPGTSAGVAAVFVVKRILLPTALGLLPTPLAAQPATTLASDSEARWIGFELTAANHIRFAATINGKPAQAILDTGVSDSVVTPEFAAGAGLRGAVRGRADAVGGAVDIAWAALRELQIGGLARRGGRIGIAALPSAATDPGSRTDALIGSDLLACCALEIDYDKRRFRLLPSGRLPFRGASAPLGYDASQRVYVSALRIGSSRVAPLLVDTGDSAELTLTRTTWTSARQPAPRGTSSGRVNGLGGPVEAEVVTNDAVRLADLALPDVEIWIEGSDGLSARRGMAGRIGSGLLRRLHLLLDPGAGRMVVAPGTGSTRTPRSTSGLVLVAEPGRLVVRYVMRNSPAAGAGWRPGERICAVDGVPVSPRAELPTDDWTRGAPGRVLQLGMCDSGARNLTLRRFY